MTQEEEIGKVIHYYDHLMVAVVVLTQDLKIGNTIRLAGKDKEFTQSVASMQVEHQPVESTKKGTEVAIKVDQPVRKNWRLYKASA